MITAIIFALALASSMIFVVMFGGRDERLGMICLVAAALLSFLATSPSASMFETVEAGIFLVDVLLLLALVALLLSTKAYWPIWATGFQIIPVFTHLAMWLQPQMLPAAYAMYLQNWAYPVLLSLIAGAIQHQRLMRMGLLH